MRRGYAGPVLSLLVVVISCLALGIVGLGVEDRLQPTSLIVPGTSSARGQALAEEHFGPSSPFAVLLRGPAAAIERQGPPLVRALRRDPAVAVVSPWDRGAVGYLRPGPGRAIVLLDYHLPLDLAMRQTVPALERTLQARVHPPRRSDPIGLCQRHQEPAIRIAEGNRARRADRRAAASDRAAARLPLVGRRCDPARLRRADRVRRARSPRPARLRDDDRSPLGGRLHDDGPRPRRRLLPLHRLPLP